MCALYTYVADRLDKPLVQIKSRHKRNKGAGDLEKATTYAKACNIIWMSHADAELISVWIKIRLNGLGECHSETN